MDTEEGKYRNINNNINGTAIVYIQKWSERLYILGIGRDVIHIYVKDCVLASRWKT